MQDDIIPSPILNQTIDELRQKGYSIQDHLLPENLVDALIADIGNLSDADWQTAGVGRKQGFTVDKDIRRDKICWINDNTETRKRFLSALEQFKQTINRTLFLGLFDYEAHFAQYEKGGFYEKHLDAFRGKSNRVLSTVLYLNETWQADDGGELIIYDDQDPDKEVERVIPQKGRFVIFLSEDFYHQVNPANKTRQSIAGWFRINQHSI